MLVNSYSFFYSITAKLCKALKNSSDYSMLFLTILSCSSRVAFFILKLGKFSIIKFTFKTNKLKQNSGFFFLLNSFHYLLDVIFGLFVTVSIFTVFEVFFLVLEIYTNNQIVSLSFYCCLFF